MVVVEKAQKHPMLARPIREFASLVYYPEGIFAENPHLICALGAQLVFLDDRPALIGGDLYRGPRGMFELSGGEKEEYHELMPGGKKWYQGMSVDGPHTKELDDVDIYDSLGLALLARGWAGDLTEAEIIQLYQNHAIWTSKRKKDIASYSGLMPGHTIAETVKTNENNYPARPLAVLSEWSLEEIDAHQAHIRRLYKELRSFYPERKLPKEVGERINGQYETISQVVEKAGESAASAYLKILAAIPS